MNNLKFLKSKVVKVLLILTISIGLFIPGLLVGQPKENPITITLWHQEQPPERVKRFQQVIDMFNQIYPGITVEQSVQAWGEAFTKTIGAIEAGRAPDLLFTIPGFTANIRSAKPEAVKPVDDLVNILQEKYDFYDSALKPYFWDNHYWAVPIYGMVHLLYYRKDVFREAGLDPNDPPETWSQLLNTMQTFIDKGLTKYGIGVPASDTLAGDQFIYSLLTTNNAGHIFDEDAEKIIFDNPKTVETYALWKKLYESSPPGSLNWKWVEPQNAMFNKKTAFAFVLGGMISNWEEHAEAPAEDLGATFIPHSEDGGRGAIFYSNGVMVLTDDKQKQQAIAKFFKFLYQPEIKGYFLNADPGLFLPVTKQTANSESFWSDPIIQKYRDIVELEIKQSHYGMLFGFTRDKVNPGIGRISGNHILAKVCQKIAIDNWSPERAVSWGAEQMKKAIE